jgi:hypothetical protein
LLWRQELDYEEVEEDVYPKKKKEQAVHTLSTTKPEEAFRHHCQSRK